MNDGTDILRAKDWDQFYGWVQELYLQGDELSPLELMDMTPACPAPNTEPEDVKIELWLDWQDKCEEAMEHIAHKYPAEFLNG